MENQTLEQLEKDLRGYKEDQIQDVAKRDTLQGLIDLRKQLIEITENNIAEMKKGKSLDKALKAA